MSNSFAEYSKKLTGIKPAREVFVAFLDILGFSGFVRNNTHDDLTKIYQAIFRSSIDYSLAEVAEQAVENSGWLKIIEEPDSQLDVSPKLDNVNLNCISISDSIILSTTGDEFKDFMTLAATVRNLMAKALNFGFPLRGGISHGKLTMDFDVASPSSKIIHHQMLGLPIVEAAELEKSQCWAGCAVLKSAADKIGPAKLMRLGPMMITICDVPLKEKGKPGGVVHELMPVVNWVQGIHDEDKSKFNADKIKESFFAHGKQVDSNAEEMILNTTKFFNKMSSHPVYKNEMSDEEYWNAVLEEMKAAEL